jgi:hypothetical protein
MSYKPNEATLVAYLYDELDTPEREKVDAYLKEHVEVAIQLQQMRETLAVMGRFSDKEVIAPPLFMDNKPNVIPLWQTPFFKTIMSIAASLLLILVVGRMAGVEVVYSDSELRISFGTTGSGKEVKEEVQPSLTENEVSQMIDQALTKNNEQWEASRLEKDERLQKSIRQVMRSGSQQTNDLVAKASLASQDQIRSYTATLQQQNLQLMKDYFQMTSAEQKQYVENILVDFSKYLQEQRTQDLMFFQTRMTTIERNTDQFKQETEQILGSIIANASVKNERNNY